MSTQVFELNLQDKSLEGLPKKSMTGLGVTEPYDLEAWLASGGPGLFDREVLWIARQDRPSDDQRSDLVGVDNEGNLLVAELKRGTFDKDGVTQALAYAAEYGRKTASDLTTLYAEASQKASSTTALVDIAGSDEDARTKITDHCGADSELNETQILLLVAEEFAPEALLICDYLNQSSGEASFSLECWRYSIFEQPEKQHLFLLEQILPPPSVREEIEQKREASKSKKYLRDPVRIEFMHGLVRYIKNHGGEITRWRNPGESYSCKIENEKWTADHTLSFNMWDGQAYLVVGEGLSTDDLLAGKDLRCEKAADGEKHVVFPDIELKTARFTPEFGERLLRVVRRLNEVPVEGQEETAEQNEPT